MLMDRSTLVIASRAAGLPGPVDGVTTALDDPGLSATEAARARRLGFAGKLCVHPHQVEAVNAAFSPSTEQINWARKVIGVYAAGRVSRVEGHMVDAPVIDKALNILAQAKDAP
jgi:citrate lyase subunit beta/citryl-CoA lyase